MTANRKSVSNASAANGRPPWAEYRQAVVGDTTPLKIPITLATGQEIGLLVAVSNATLARNDVIDAFTRWRTTYGRFFLTQFTPTQGRTRNWLKAILADERRMLFTIHTGDSLVGHYGFRDLHAGTAEVDNLLRGERGGHPGLMQATVLALSDWLFTRLDVHTVFGNILADNPLALKLHTDAGFALGERRPLTLIHGEHENRWMVGPPGGASPHNKFYQQVLLQSRP
jgi:RimJ/RimL family protein N-acetyltransferase